MTVGSSLGCSYFCSFQRTPAEFSVSDLGISRCQFVRIRFKSTSSGSTIRRDGSFASPFTWARISLALRSSAKPTLVRLLLALVFDLRTFIAKSSFSQRIGPKKRQHFRQSPPAMAHLHFGLQRRFSESTAEGRIVEQRIVSEAIFAARGEQDFAFHFTSKVRDDLRALRQRDHADKSRAAILDALHLFEQQPVVFHVARFRTGEASRMYSGRTAERIHYQTGVFREYEAVAKLR